MNTPSLTLQPSGRAALRAILAGGLIAGTIDIGAAALINRINPLVIMRFIAGGLLGKTALQGGLTASAWGMLLQWLMSLLIAAIFVVAASRLRWLTARPTLSGLAYGVVVYFVMNYVVMPLSAWHRVPPFRLVSFVENLVAMLVFGLIIAFCARRELRRG